MPDGHVFRELTGRHAGSAVRDAKKLFGMQSFRISGRETWMSDHHFHRSAGRFCISGRKTWIPFPPVGPTVHYFTISFPLGSSQEVFASRAAEPECRTTIFTGQPGRLLFNYFIFSIGLQPRGFCISGRKTWMSDYVLLHLGQPFCMPAHVFACRPNVSPTSSAALLGMCDLPSIPVHLQYLGPKASTNSIFRYIGSISWYSSILGV